MNNPDEDKRGSLPKHARCLAGMTWRNYVPEGVSVVCRSIEGQGGLQVSRDSVALGLPVMMCLKDKVTLIETTM